MKKTLTLSMLLITSICFGQIQPYLDIGAVWKPWMQGGGSLDIGANFNRFSVEVNGIGLEYSRVGGSVGWQCGERGGEWLGMRPYAGMMYGKYSVSKKENADIVKKWNYTVGAKLMCGSWESNFQIIMAKNPEYYITVGFQIVEIYKWAFNKK